MRGLPGPTRRLLGCGRLAGPLYVGVGVVEILTRDGFDIRRHALSLMSNGDLGWIQVASFLLSGALVLLGAVGVRRALYPGAAGTWAPMLLGLYGLGLIGAGLFVADPMDGFPLGTPAGAPAVITPHGMLHFVFGGIGFVGLTGACLVIARRFLARGETGWGLWSAATGIGFFGSFGWIASGAKGPAVILTFYVAVLLSWVWHFSLFARLRREG